VRDRDLREFGFVASSPAEQRRLRVRFMYSQRTAGIVDRIKSAAIRAGMGRARQQQQTVAAG